MYTFMYVFARVCMHNAFMRIRVYMTAYMNTYL